MDTLEAIYKRRAVKHFDPDHELSEEEIQKLLEAAIQSPTSFNIQHWRFVVVTDPELRKRIRANGNDQAQMTDASMLVVMTADMKAWQKDPQRYWQNAPKEVADLLVNWMGPFHEGKEQLQRDEAQRSIGLAMQTLMLAAVDMGYQCCPMIGFRFRGRRQADQPARGPLHGGDGGDRSRHQGPLAEAGPAASGRSGHPEQVLIRARQLASLVHPRRWTTASGARSVKCSRPPWISSLRNVPPTWIRPAATTKTCAVKY